MIDDRPGVKTHHPRKRFGQNFLVDDRVIARMILAIAPRTDQHLVEIGPGRGALTIPISNHSALLDVIELDRNLIPALTAMAVQHPTMRVHAGDALSFDFSSLGTDTHPIRIIGNLPYNISTPLLFHLMKYAGHIEDMHFTLQEEVVDRLAAAPGQKSYGRLSVMIQYYCRVEKLFTIAPQAFYPAPKVSSAFVRLTPHHEAPVKVADRGLLAQVVKLAFSYRRKTLRNALKSMTDAATIVKAGIDPGKRGEQLNLEEFSQLSNEIAKNPR
jgi:16S rRNA (adenine1518-N6/adenine1519-N6)-dimethyltransferase